MSGNDNLEAKLESGLNNKDKQKVHKILQDISPEAKELLFQDPKMVQLKQLIETSNKIMKVELADTKDYLNQHNLKEQDFYKDIQQYMIEQIHGKSSADQKKFMSNVTDVLAGKSPLKGSEIEKFLDQHPGKYPDADKLIDKVRTDSQAIAKVQDTNFANLEKEEHKAIRKLPDGALINLGGIRGSKPTLEKLTDMLLHLNPSDHQGNTNPLNTPTNQDASISKKIL